MTAKDVKKTSVVIEWLSAKIPRIGVWFAALGAFSFTVSEACAKLLANDVTAEVVISVRYILHAFATAPLLLRVSNDVYHTSLSSWIYAIAGGLAAGLTTYTAYYSYHYIPLSDTLVLNNAQPIFAAIIACIWLKERLTLYDVVIMILTMVGIVIACQPSFIFGQDLESKVNPTARTIGSALALAGAMLMALVTCLSRKIRHVESSIIVYLQGLGGVMVGFIGALASCHLSMSENLTPVQIIALVSTSVCGYTGRYLFIFSVQTEDATLVAVLQTLEIPFSFVLQLVMLDTYPNLLSVLGAIIVMVGAALLSWKENVKKKAKNLKESFKRQFMPSVNACHSTNNANERMALVGGD